MALPSINGLPLTLSKSGRTCLTPTFKAGLAQRLKSTDFSDVLTFTIVTSPRRGIRRFDMGVHIWEYI